MKSTSKSPSSVVLFSLVCVTALHGCAADSEEPASPAPAPSWEEFRDRARVGTGDQERYVVEGDLQLSPEQLRAYYLSHWGDETPAGAGARSTVNIVDDKDDVWSVQKRAHLTLCVDDDFGTGRSEVVTTLRSAASAWNAAAPSIHFELTSGGSCAGGALIQVNRMNPLAENTYGSAADHLAESFSPGFRDQQGGILFLNFANIHPTRLHSVFLHELGHVLGLRHEFVRVNQTRDICKDLFAGQPARNWQPVTPYDSKSIMTYRSSGILGGGVEVCGGDPDGTLTELDKEGVRILYGDAPGRVVLNVEYTGCQQHLPGFAVDWRVAHGNRPTSFELDVKRGATGAWEPLLRPAAGGSTLYRGYNKRTDRLRARACFGTVCSPYTGASAYADCSELPR